jgi:hypothetical protein
MALSKHDAEEETRQLDGRVLDAAMAAGNSRSLYVAEQTRFNSESLIASQDKLINRQAELIAKLRELMRQAVA